MRETKPVKSITALLRDNRNPSEDFRLFKFLLEPLFFNLRREKSWKDYRLRKVLTKRGSNHCLFFLFQFSLLGQILIMIIVLLLPRLWNRHPYSNIQLFKIDSVAKILLCQYFSLYFEHTFVNAWKTQAFLSTWAV